MCHSLLHFSKVSSSKNGFLEQVSVNPHFNHYHFVYRKRLSIWALGIEPNGTKWALDQMGIIGPN